MYEMDDVPLLTMKEVMRYLRISRSTAYRLIESGHLPAHKVGSTWRFYRHDVRACIEKQVISKETPNEDTLSYLRTIRGQVL